MSLGYCVDTRIFKVLTTFVYGIRYFLLHFAIVELIKEEIECGVFHYFLFLVDAIWTEVLWLELHELLQYFETYCWDLLHLLWFFLLCLQVGWEIWRVCWILLYGVVLVLFLFLFFFFLLVLCHFLEIPHHNLEEIPLCYIPVHFINLNNLKSYIYRFCNSKYLPQ